MNKVKDVIVIGAGIIGLATAYYLARENKKVLVLEKEEIGAGASGACDDMILLQSKKPGILLEMALESLDMYKHLSDELDVDLEFQNLGGMILIETEKQLSIMEEFVENQNKHGLNVEILDKETVIKKQPFVSRRVVASTYSSIDSQVNPFRVMQGFIKKGQELGMEIKKHSPVKRIKTTKTGLWEVETDNGEKFSSKVVVNAAGAWAPEICKLVEMDIPIKPKRGQIAITEQIPPLGETNIWDAEYIVTKLNPSMAPKRKKILAELGIGLSFTRTHDGNYFIGGTREFVGYDKGTTIEGISNIVTQALRYFPILSNVNIIRTFGGLRPASLDGKPFLGEIEGLSGFFVAAGHEGDGIALAPVTGKLMAQLISGQKPFLSIEELAPTKSRGVIMSKN